MSERQLQEVMVDFWENHFTVFAGKGQTRYYLTSYDRDVIRPNALGHFRDLLGAVAKSPAMLFYLDNAQSVADSTRQTLGGQFAGNRQRAAGNRVRLRRPGLVGARRPNQGTVVPGPGGARPPQQRRSRGLNENYARELMELHTLGVDGGYTQKDVIEVARALTGWGIRPPAQGGGFIFRPEWHDAGEKTILGQRFPAGHGEDEGERVLDMVARSQIGRASCRERG